MAISGEFISRTRSRLLQVPRLVQVGAVEQGQELGVVQVVVPGELDQAADRIGGGHLLVECLVAQGVTHAFGVPGESYLAVLDGFHKHADRIRFMITRQEGGAAFMAEAHGKLTGRPGVCFVTRGPGPPTRRSACTPRSRIPRPWCCWWATWPATSATARRSRRWTTAASFGPSTKGHGQAGGAHRRCPRIPEYVARAFATALNGRPGPVVLVLPEDMLTTPWPPPAGRRAAEAVQAWSDPGALRDLRELLLAAQRPLVIAGGGGWTPQAAQACSALPKTGKLPVGNAFRFQDTFDNHHRCTPATWASASTPSWPPHPRGDLILAIGPRLGEDHGRLHAADAPKAGAEAGAHPCQRRRAQPGVPGRPGHQRHHECRGPQPGGADRAAAGALGLGEACARRLPGQSGAAGRCCPATSTCPAIVATLQKHLPADAVLTNGAGNFASWVHRFFRHHGLAKGHKTQLAPTNGQHGLWRACGHCAAITTGRTVFTIAATATS
jgi:acetolactate synthase-1/2/3 large subunit